MRLAPYDEKTELLLEKGILVINEEIDDAKSEMVLVDLLFMSFKGIKPPYWIILDCPGGEANQGLAIYDTVKIFVESGIPINILCMGEVASMATVILQAGSRRYSLSNTQFLIHQISQFIHTNEEVSEGEERVAENKRVNSICLGLIAQRVGMDLSELTKLARKKDFWLDARAALKFGTNGLIDEIVAKLPFNLTA